LCSGIGDSVLPPRAGWAAIDDSAESDGTAETRRLRASAAAFTLMFPQFEPPFGARWTQIRGRLLADAADLLQLEAEHHLRQIGIRDDHEAVRFLQVGAHLAEEDVRREADRAGEALRPSLESRGATAQRR
jgi:hypothetical protein